MTPIGIGLATMSTQLPPPFLTDDPPQTRMHRRVHVDHRGSGNECVFIDVVDLDMALPRRIGGRVARDGDEIIETGDRPEAFGAVGFRRPGEASGRSHLGEGSLRNACLERQRIVQIDRWFAGFGHCAPAGISRRAKCAVIRS